MTTPTVVLVTGVSSGIGRTTAEQFARRGCEVYGTVRNLATAAHCRALPWWRWTCAIPTRCSAP